MASYPGDVAEVVEGKRVTWAEGFFDLVFVLAVTQVATLLGEHHQWWGLGRAFIVLALVYRTWVSTSLQTNRLSRDSTRDRITLFGVGFCGLVMAIAIPHVYDSGGMQFALAYWAAPDPAVAAVRPAVPAPRGHLTGTERHRDRADARRRSAVARHVA